MKRLMLLAILCVGGAVVAPITSASAELVGACTINGNATFSQGLPFVEPAPRGYTFVSTSASCTGTNTETKAVETKEASATLSGHGELSCAVANGLLEVKGEVKGGGTLKIEAGLPNEFAFAFVAAGGTVHFTAKGEVNAVGTAQFLNPGNQAAKEKRLAECRAGAVVELPFEAVTAGTVKKA